MSRRALHVAVILLVGVAGCSGLAGVDNDRGITVTPADVPTDVATQTSIEDLPFVHSNKSFIDPAALAAKHRESLHGQSFTVVTTQRIRFPASNQSGRWELTVAIAPSGAFNVASVRSGSVFVTGRPSRIEFWSNGDIVVEAFLDNDTATANIVRDARGNPVPPTTVMPINPHFEGELQTIYAATRVHSMTPLNDSDQSPGLIRLTAAGPVGNGFGGSLGPISTVRNLTATVHITEQGFVKRVRIRYSGEFAGDPVTVTRTVRYTSVGETTVVRPDWVDEALAGSDYDLSSGTNGSS